MWTNGRILDLCALSFSTSMPSNRKQHKNAKMNAKQETNSGGVLSTNRKVAATGKF
jgi:hypothetical protein